MVVPQTMTDVWMTMLSQVSGAILFGVFIGNAINVVEEMDAARSAYRSKVAQVGFNVRIAMYLNVVKVCKQFMSCLLKTVSYSFKNTCLFVEYQLTCDAEY